MAYNNPEAWLEMINEVADTTAFYQAWNLAQKLRLLKNAPEGD